MMKNDCLKRFRSAIRMVMEEEAAATGFTWGQVAAVWVCLPITVCVTMMLYTSAPISGKPYLLLMPSAGVTVFALMARKYKWFHKDFRM